MGPRERATRDRAPRASQAHQASRNVRGGAYRRRRADGRRGVKVRAVKPVRRDLVGDATIVQIPWAWPLGEELPARPTLDRQRRAAERRARRLGRPIVTVTPPD